MDPIRLTGRVNENGLLEIDQPGKLPPGEVVIIIESVSSEVEAEDEARWSALFAGSQDQLAEMADQALRDLDAGRFEDLDPDQL